MPFDPDSTDTIPVDDGYVLRQAISRVRALLEKPDSRLRHVHARLAIENLEAHLPEVLAAAEAGPATVSG